MKKKLEKIFDEATPNELDRFSDALGAAEASGEELAAIKSKVYARLEIKKKKRDQPKYAVRGRNCRSAILDRRTETQKLTTAQQFRKEE